MKFKVEDGLFHNIFIMDSMNLSEKYNLTKDYDLEPLSNIS
jgi:hypothetical protein